MELSAPVHNTPPKALCSLRRRRRFKHWRRLASPMTGYPERPPTPWKNVLRSARCWAFRSARIWFLCNRQKTQFYLLVMGPDKPFHTKDLSHQIGSARLSFAPEELLWELLHCTPGSATVLGLVHDTAHQVRLLMDREIYESAYMSCHPCICTSSLKLKTSDILRKFLPHTGHEVTVVDL